MLVFNSFPADKAKDLMQLANMGNSDQNSTLVPKAATDPVVPQLNLSKPAQPNLSGNASTLVVKTRFCWNLFKDLLKS